MGYQLKMFTFVVSPMKNMQHTVDGEISAPNHPRPPCMLLDFHSMYIFWTCRCVMDACFTPNVNDHKLTETAVFVCQNNPQATGIFQS